MTAPERPAGRPACGARPAGARPDDDASAALEQLVDRSTRPCLHPRARHEHGTHLAFKCDGCRCEPCCAAHRRHGKLTAYRTATGTHSYVSADRARAHVHQLLEVLTVGQIEQRSGVNRTSIRVLAGDFPNRPPSRRITRTTERALLAVSAERVGAERHGLVDGTGTRRRLRALIALGWPAKHLATRLAWSSRTTWYMTCPATDEAAPVRASTRDAVRTLYDQLSFAVPPQDKFALRTRRLAARRGWVPPLAWDDDAIDDPAARPRRAAAGTAFDEIAVGRAMAGDDVHLRPAERAEAVRQLTAAGLSAAEIAARLHTTQRSVVRHRSAQTRRSA